MTTKLNDWFEQILRCRQNGAAKTVTRCVRRAAEIRKEEKRKEEERKRKEKEEKESIERENEINETLAVTGYKTVIIILNN